MPSTNKTTWHDDTLREMCKWAAKKYRLGRVYVVWRDFIPKPKRGGVASGRMTCFGDEPPFYIELLERRTHRFLIQVLIHELAHCVVVRDRKYHGHGPIFIRTLERMTKEWNGHSEACESRNKRRGFNVSGYED